MFLPSNICKLQDNSKTKIKTIKSLIQTLFMFIVLLEYGIYIETKEHYDLSVVSRILVYCREKRWSWASKARRNATTTSPVEVDDIRRETATWCSH